LLVTARGISTNEFEFQEEVYGEVSLSICHGAIAMIPARPHRREMSQRRGLREVHEPPPKKFGESRFP
jgi:hypothetical protein